MKMTPRFIYLAVFTAASIAIASEGIAEDEDIQSPRDELKSLRAELAELRTSQRDLLTDEKRRVMLDAEIDRVYAAAKKRAAANGVGPLAGIDESGKIFFKSADGAFSARLCGLIQFRYLWNSLEGTNGSRNTSVSGFQHRRVKFGIRGGFFDNWGYKLVFATNRGTGPAGGNAFTEESYIPYDFGDGWSMLAGTNKLPFARQEIISVARQVGVDRSLVNEFFTLNRTDQFAINYKADTYKATLAV